MTTYTEYVKNSYTEVENIYKVSESGGQLPAGTTDHLLLKNIGDNTHAEIDTHISDTSNPHSVTKTQVGLENVTNDAQALIGKITPHVTPLLNATATFTASSTDNTITVDADCNFAYNGFSGSQNISTTQVTIIGTVSITLIGFDVALDSKINLSNMSPGIYHVVAKSYDSGATGYVWASQAA